MKKNILLISTSLKTQGGVSTVVQALLNSKLAQEYNLMHLATHLNGSAPVKIGYLLQSYVKFPWIVLFKKVDLIHVHGSMKVSFFRKSYFVLVGKMLHKKVIYHMHAARSMQAYFGKTVIRKFLAYKIIKLYDLVIALSTVWAEKLTELTVKPVKIIYNPITCKAPPDRENRNRITVLAMGEIGERKGSYDIIKAAAHLRNEKIDFILYGNGDINGLQSLIARNNLQDKVMVHGWISGRQVDEAYRKADIFILPSYAEGQPMSVLEALSYSLPVVVTPVGGIPDAVQNGVNGFLIRPGDYGALAEKIALLAEDETLRKSMGRASYEIAHSKFNMDRIVTELKNIYGQLLEG